MLESNQSHSAVAPWQAAGYSLREIVAEDEQTRRSDLEARIAYHQERVEREEQVDGYVQRWREVIQAKTRDSMAARSEPVRQRRLRIARLLQRGPLTMRKILDATGLAYNLVDHATRYEWFERVGYWSIGLSEKGKRVVERMERVR